MEDIEYIEMLPDIKAFGTVVIDDFHRLPESTKIRIGDLLKVTADASDGSRKLIIIGINQAGQALIDSSPDLPQRVEFIRFEVEPPQKIDELVRAGEKALNIQISARNMITEKSQGSFYVAQTLCWEACVQADVTEAAIETQNVDTSFAAVQRKVVQKQRDRFGETVRGFARGTKFRPGGRAPYMHVLKWLSEADSFSISIPEQMQLHSKEKQSVGVVLERGYLQSLCDGQDIARLIHFDHDTRVLSVEDPMLVFYLRNITWSEFVKEVGFTKVDYEQVYDIALSFAGEDRVYAEYLRDALEDLGHAVFYDLASQHRLLGEDVEAFLKPIYESNSRYVVAIIGPQYGRKRWTLLEESAYKNRYKNGDVIPIWSNSVSPTPSDPVRSLGGLNFDEAKDFLEQAKNHAQNISMKLNDTA